MALYNWKGGVLTALTAFSLYGCTDEPSKASSAPATEQRAQPATEQKGKIVTLDEPMMKNITVEELKEKSLPQVLTTTGKVQFNEEQMARILAPVSGQVQQLHIKVGDTVKAGAVLFFIHSR